MELPAPPTINSTGLRSIDRLADSAGPRPAGGTRRGSLLHLALSGPVRTGPPRRSVPRPSRRRPRATQTLVPRPQRAWRGGRRDARISRTSSPSHFPHFGEEDCLRGWRGSGTIFFSGCNLRCVFCQNYDITGSCRGSAVTPDAARATDARAPGARLSQHQLRHARARRAADPRGAAGRVGAGCALPIVYNTSAYDSPESLALLDGVVDIYMPDFKLWSRRARPALSRQARLRRGRARTRPRDAAPGRRPRAGRGRAGAARPARAPPGHARAARRDARRSCASSPSELGPSTYVNVMAQYYPAGRTSEFPEIDRHLYRSEFERALEMADDVGLRRLDQRSRAAVGRLAAA